MDAGSACKHLPSMSLFFSASRLSGTSAKNSLRASSHGVEVSPRAKLSIFPHPSPNSFIPVAETLIPVTSTFCRLRQCLAISPRGHWDKACTDEEKSREVRNRPQRSMTSARTGMLTLSLGSWNAHVEAFKSIDFTFTHEFSTIFCQDVQTAKEKYYRIRFL